MSPLAKWLDVPYNSLLLGLWELTDFSFLIYINGRRQRLNGYYFCALIFLQFKEFESYWGAVFLQLEEKRLFIAAKL